MQYLLTQAEFETRLTPEESDKRVKAAKLQAAKALLRFTRRARQSIVENASSHAMQEIKRASEALFYECGLSEEDMRKASEALDQEMGPYIMPPPQTRG